MPRTEVAIILLLILAIAAAAVIFLTARYQHYKRRIERGSRHAKPVWKPFWIH